MTEEQRKQCEEIIDSYEEKHKKDSEEISKLSIPIAEGLQKKYEIYSFLYTMNILQLYEECLNISMVLKNPNFKLKRLI